jgi:hypothetical protein
MMALFGYVRLILTKERPENTLGSLSGIVAFGIVVLTSALLLIFEPFLYRIEIYVLSLALLPALALTFVRVFETLTLPGYRLAVLSLCILPLILMSQTVSKRTGTQKVYHSIKAGYSNSWFRNHIVHDTDPGSCGGVVDSEDFNHDVNVAAVGYSNTHIREKYIYELGLNFFYGKHTETMKDAPQSKTYNLYGLNPYITFDSKWIGFGVGLHLGSTSFAMFKSVKQSSSQVSTGSFQSAGFPQLSFRIFPKEYFFIEYELSSKFPSPMAAFNHDISVGSGFGIKNGFNLKIGTTCSSLTTPYVSGYIPIKNRFVIEPLFSWSESETYMLGLHYRFRHKESLFQIKNP